MNIRAASKILIAFVFLLPNSVLAGKKARAIQHGTMVGNQTGDAITAGSQASSGVNETEYDSIKQSSVDNMNNGQKGQSVAYLMAGGLAVAAARYYGMCSGWNLAACAAGAVLASMAMSADKSGDSFSGPNAASWNNVCQYSTSGCGAMPNPYKAAVDVNKKNKALKDANEINNSKGVSVDASSGIVRFPDGKEVNMNDSTSMNAVLGAETTSEILSEAKKVEQQALKKIEQLQPSSLAEAYGLGSGAAMLTDVSYEDESSIASANTSNARIPAQVQVMGLSVDFNGEPVGVSGDDLFGIMSRRYIKENKVKPFIFPEPQTNQ